MGRTVTKRDVIRDVSRKTGISHDIVSKITYSVIGHLAEELVAGNRIEFRGFGVFQLVGRKQRRAQDLSKKIPVIVPPRTVVRFKPGKELKERVAGLEAFKSDKKT